MEIIRAFEIAGREWGNIRSSLEMCGDIGEFDSENPINSRITKTEGSRLVENLIDMENKFQTNGYFTQEAACVFTAIASKAAVRLRLTGRLAWAFGSGYSLIRTGCLDPNVAEKHHLKQMVFFKLFFPIGAGFNWKFHSPVVKVKLKTIFDKFVLWQDSPRTYIQEVRKYKDQLEPPDREILL